MSDHGDEVTIDAHVSSSDPAIRRVGVSMFLACHGIRIFAYIAKHIRAGFSWIGAEDIYHDTIVKLIQAADSGPFNSARCMSGWSFKTARNCLVDAVRDRVAERIEQVDVEGEGAEETAKPDSDGDSALRQAILDGLAKLTKLELQALILWIAERETPDRPPAIGKLAEKIYGPSTTETEKQKKKDAFRHRRDAGLAKLRAHLIRLGYWHEKRR